MSQIPHGEGKLERKFHDLYIYVPQNIHEIIWKWEKVNANEFLLPFQLTQMYIANKYNWGLLYMNWQPLGLSNHLKYITKYIMPRMWKINFLSKSWNNSLENSEGEEYVFLLSDLYQTQCSLLYLAFLFNFFFHCTRLLVCIFPSEAQHDNG